MFQQLHALLQSCSSLTLLITASSETELTVTVIPKSTNDTKEAALATPLQLTATPQELDEGFVGALTSYTVSRGSLAEQVEATATILESAKKNSEKAATKAIAGTPAKPAAKSTPQAKPDSGDNLDEDDDAASGSPAQVATGNETAIVASASQDLWGNDEGAK